MAIVHQVTAARRLAARQGELPGPRRLRRWIATHKDLVERLDRLEQKYDGRFAAAFEAIRELMRPPACPRRPIGFRIAAARTKAGR
jgi:hypothetical protein